MICNRKAFVLATGCPQISVDISFPSLSFCSTPDYTDPRQCEQCIPQQLPEPDINFPGAQKCFSAHITMFTGWFSRGTAFFHVINTQAEEACHASRAIGIRPGWGCQLVSKFPREIPFINGNEWDSHRQFGAIRVTISPFCSVELIGDVDLRLILPEWDQLGASDICVNSGKINLIGIVQDTDPGVRFTATKAEGETCKLVTRKLTYTLPRFIQTNVAVTKFYPRQRMTCFVADGQARCKMVVSNVARIFNVIKFVTSDEITHTFMATGVSCIKGPCCTFEKMTIVTWQKVVNRGRYRNDILIWGEQVTLKLRVPACHTMLTTVTSDQFYGKITLNRKTCGIDGKIIIRDYGKYRKMALHKLSSDDAILSVHFGTNRVEVTPDSTTPCDILPPKLDIYIEPAKLFPIIGGGDIEFDAIGDATYNVTGKWDDLTIWSGVTGSRGPTGPTGPTGATGRTGRWYTSECQCDHEGVCTYDSCPEPCDISPALCKYYGGTATFPGIPGYIDDIRTSGHDIIIMQKVFNITFEFRGNSPNKHVYIKHVSMRIHGWGIFCTEQ